ncbi:cupin domain-containing protein [Desulfobacterales bacterium HSG16]|nr:cupin domain-containing protein [Desulfobacterales bacterium HSG16]
MEKMSFNDREAVKMEKIPFKGKDRNIIGTSIRWLSQCGDDGFGYPEYGLRHFTIEPGGEIPIHNHFYHQTMYILTGTFECYEYDMDSEEKTRIEITGPGDFVFVPSMEPHGMKNIGEEPATFLCCIGNVYEKE